MLTGQILLQMIIILIVVQVFGFLCRRIGQQWVIGEILAGLALGPSLLGAFLPGVKGFIFPPQALPTLQTLGDLGLVLYMFSLGTRLDTHFLLRQGKTALFTSLSGILLPFLSGGILAFFLFSSFSGPHATPLSFMLLVGTAMAITAFPVLARILNEKNLLSTKVGTLALTCAAVDDVIAWCLLALIVAVVHARGLPSALLTIGFTLLFALGLLTVVRPLFAYADKYIQSKQILLVLSITLLLISAYTTNAIGIHPIFGAFLMGIILPRKVLYVELVNNVERINALLFLPLYFVYSGLRTQVGLISSPWLWLICLLILAISCGGKVFGCMFTFRLTGASLRDALSLGILMNTRGLVELIVLNIGLDLGILSPTLFTMLVIMALVTTMMASPLLFLLGYRQETGKEVRDEETKDVQRVMPDALQEPTS